MTKAKIVLKDGQVIQLRKPVFVRNTKRGTRTITEFFSKNPWKSPGLIPFAECPEKIIKELWEVIPVLSTFARKWYGKTFHRSSALFRKPQTPAGRA